MRWRRTIAEDPTPFYDGIELLSLMATGKRTSTWDAFDTVRGTRCIVKVIRHHRRDDHDVRQSVLRESAVLAELDHPHIVRGYGLLADGTQPNQPLGFAMQTMPGATLDAVIDNGRLSVADTVQLGIQLSSALQYLHRHKWIHLDVKPANVIVHGGQAALIDLGIVARQGEHRTGSGTRGYLSPEQADGRPLTSQADTFALGITLLEGLSGEMPFGDESIWRSRRRIPVWHRRMPTRPQGLPTHRAPELAGLLSAMMHLDPVHRPTMSEVSQRLRGLA
ncbi:serine/threonine-protein kinase [Gordonia sp. LSe1-13]|uniref:Serine/threonine-protein kinase n=1 Tax=Gordonia sesuvii TaxID=3116777 RepID=A0ABU7MHE7_9ACTN|nr:serine/threonine-protein kinase [Gordonia sp. LSe1-13]